MTDVSQCIGASAWSDVGTDCRSRYKQSFVNTVKVIVREPVVLVRALEYCLSQMQDISVDYIGKYSRDDPRSRWGGLEKQSAERRFPPTEKTVLNLWSNLKYYCFPTGYPLALVLTAFVGWFTFLLKRFRGIYLDIATVGLLTSLACILHVGVSILGDGKFELIKHLFLSNVAFDVALIAFVNSVFCLWFDHRNSPIEGFYRRNYAGSH